MCKIDIFRRSICMIWGVEDSNWFLRGCVVVWFGEGCKRFGVEVGSVVVLYFYEVLVG